MLGKERVYTNKALQSIYSMQAKGNSNPHYQDWTTNHFYVDKQHTTHREFQDVAHSVVSGGTLLELELAWSAFRARAAVAVVK